MGTEIPDYGNDKYKVPKSCCKKNLKGEELKGDAITKCQETPDTELKGCYQKLKDSVKNHKTKILGVAITILVIMVSCV